MSTKEGKQDPNEGESGSDEKETKREEPDASPPLMKAMPPNPNTLPSVHVTNRPPSVASTHSNTSTGTPRMTTTSRRGGRTRSRSPPSMANRSSSPKSEREFEGAPPAANQSRSKSPANPSSAAAAAAAAAKALSNTSGGRNGVPWYEGGEGELRERRNEHPRYHHEYDTAYQGSRWPPEDGADRHEYGRPLRARPMESDPRHYAGPYAQGPHRSRRHYEQHYGGGYEADGYPGRPRYEGGPYDQARRYDHRRDDRYYRKGMKPHHSGDPYTTKPDTNGAASPPSAKRNGGTSRVIGTATPIHVPRAPVQQPPPRQAGTPSSVFRGRPGDESEAAPTREEDGTQKILMSLRTPTSSFEELPKNRKSKDPPLSPEAPPQIQNCHQNSGEQALFFDRGSPKTGASGTLEAAPSFSLFNQSFDSLGDTAQYLNVGTPLEGAFPSASFGAGPTGSGDKDGGDAFPIPGVESFTAGTSNSVGLTFGMSPVNSFGNGTPTGSSRSMMVLGGPDQQPTSPTQMLSMYPSYSGGYGSQSSGPFRPRGGQMTDNPMRSMSSGSFGGPGMYSRSFTGPDGSPRGQYQLPHEASRAEEANGPAFYNYLVKHKGAFIRCSFLLPGLKEALVGTSGSDHKKPGDETDKNRRQVMFGGRRGRFPDPSTQDIAIAMRRVASAVCAFGGNLGETRSATRQNRDEKQSVFREKDGGERRSSPAPDVTASSEGRRNEGKPRPRKKYDELLPTRYYENENRLSWEFEENPPIGDDQRSREINKAGSISGEGGSENSGDKVKLEGGSDQSRVMSPPPQTRSNSSQSEGEKKAAASDQPKMRYRCKLCGQPKQNHTCPYQQSLQRSIGTMVYPAVNAFTSSEPGMLAPALSEMNNFISSGSEISSTENSPNRPTPDRARLGIQNSASGPNPPNVTPETSRSAPSPTGSVSGSSITPSRNPFRTPSSSKRKHNMSGGAAMSQHIGSASPSSSGARKRGHAQISSDEDLLFVDAVELKPEQFRIVTPQKRGETNNGYIYPSLPLPYAQRKRLSDNLFALSKEVPLLTDECAVVLREAREKDMWDLAVAELMTQVVVVIHCTDGDSRFEGLRHYLLTLGIAC